MATPLFQPSHIVGNLIFFLFFFLRKEKEKKLTKLKTFFLMFLLWGFWIGWDRDGGSVLYFSFSAQPLALI